MAKRLAIMISGGGSTMSHIVRSCRNGKLKGLATVELVLVQKGNAAGITNALKIGVQADRVFELKNKTKSMTLDDFGQQMIDQFEKHAIELVFLCGFIPRIPKNVIGLYKGSIFNQHPGPLDPVNKPYHIGGKGMRGRRVHATVLNFNKIANRPLTHTECCAHHVVAGLDEGDLVAWKKVEIKPDDTAEALAARVLPFEHALVESTIIELCKLEGTQEMERLKRTEVLIDPGDYDSLKVAKRLAVKQWPDG
jgi:folate-dependent phosphoribosylglycinamide formyltransferase PurN